MRVMRVSGKMIENMTLKTFFDCYQERQKFRTFDETRSGRFLLTRVYYSLRRTGPVTYL